MVWSAEFLAPEEEALTRRFLERGYVVLPSEDPAGLERIRNRIAALTAVHLGLPAPAEAEVGEYLDGIHAHVDAARLNALRLAVFEGVNAEPWLHQAYHAQARTGLATLVGNELAMQRRVNLSIQLPNDESSLLPIHADVWSGDSPFEVVVWIPLVDCRRTKSMFILPAIQDALVHPELRRFDGCSSEELYRHVEPDLEWIDIRFGEVLIFTQNLMHGNRINREPETRWSMNCRFKGLFTPYADKRLGEFFIPITLRPATRLGLDYRLPEGFGG